ncbi:hypothetical protein FBQ96_01180 [Nitrospirales bacterium NOB]|nr:MAG: hypothetical protein UZ03_NOB001002480 [Nitrospira sp. OLB3]MBV6469271.1 hypothetical protein [Nitrospirota bacterium]MCE7964765.1 hypothetical protein [Nitrospira sp. NTP2]MCK6492516.1 hypothetical protein [Nitrospira sp.]MDL1888192.1 hypothetical protein [Nitrospirales bacterium NOB]MEB2337815.1 hypothetical protein [Nitrospirales bacterium]
MRNVLALGAAVLLVGSVGVAGAQERLPQSSSGSGFGVGAGVGDVSGNSGRTAAFDRNAFMERLSQPETVFGRVLGIDIPGHKLHLETGGSSHDEGRAGTGAMSSLTLYFDNHTNLDQIKSLNAGDDISVQVVEAPNERADLGIYGSGRKLVREVYLFRGNEKLAGFGGLGQRPSPSNERGIETNSGTVTGGPVGGVMPGTINSGVVTTSVGEFTGTAPCWNCEPQPGWGYQTVAPETKVQNKSDYGTDAAKPNLQKGLN